MRTAPLAVVILMGVLPAARSAPPEQAVFVGKPLTHWVGLLNDDNPLIREEAVAVLGEVGEPAREALPALLPLLKATDGRLRVRAAIAVWRIERQSKNVLPVLMLALRDTDLESRLLAIRLLEQMGTAAVPAAPALVVLLDDDEITTRGRASTALRQMAVDAIPALLDGLKARGPVGRFQCVQLLHTFSRTDKKVGDALAERMKDDDKKVRLEAARTLLLSVPHRKAVVAALTEAAKDSDPVYRRTAVSNVFTVVPRPRELLEVFVGLLDDPDPQVAASAVQAVWEFTNDAKRVTPAISRLLQEEDNVRRFMALNTLRQMGPAALPCLPALLHGPTTDTAVVGDIVRNIGPEALPHLLDACTGNRNAQTRLKAVAGLGHAGPDALPQLMRLMSDANVNIRNMAVRSVGFIGPKASEALPTLVKFARDEDPGFRSAALGSIGRLGVEAKLAVPILLESLKDKNNTVRHSAVSALAMVPLDAKTALPALDAAIKATPEAFFRLPAVQLRLRLDPDAAPLIPVIADLLNDATSQQQIIGTLGQMGPTVRSALPALMEFAQNGKAAAYSQLQLITAMGQIDPEGKTIAPALIKLVRDRDRQVRMAALVALGRTGQECDVTPVLAELRSNDVVSRQQLHSALRRLGPKATGATPTLLELVRAPDSPDRLEAAETLCKVAPEQIEVGKRILLDALGEGKTAKLEVARGLLSVEGTNARALKVFEEARGRPALPGADRAGTRGLQAQRSGAARQTVPQGQGDWNPPRGHPRALEA
jgi:HEAT repeat protein